MCLLVRGLLKYLFIYFGTCSIFFLEKLLATFPNFIFAYLYPTFYFECTVLDCIDRNKEHLETKNRGKNGETVNLGCKIKYVSAKAAKQV